MIIINKEKIKPEKHPNTEFVVLGVSNQSGIFINEKLKGKEIKQVYYRVCKKQFCYNPYRINVGSIGLNEFDYENQIISGAYNVFGVNEKEITPKYLEALFKTSHFNDYVNLKACGGVRMDFRIEYMQDLQIPLPPLEIQREIVAKIEKQKAIIEAAKKIEENWEASFDIFKDFQTMHISDFAELNPVRDYLGLDDDTLVSFIPMDAIDETSGIIKKFIMKPLKDVKKGYTFFAENDVLFAKITPCMENGKIVVAKNLYNGIGFGTTELHVFRAKPDKVLPRYIFYLVRTKHFRDRARESMTGASGHKRVPEKFLMEFPYPLAPLSIQQEIIAKLDKEMEALEDVRLLRQEAERRIEKIISEVWGE